MSCSCPGGHERKSLDVHIYNVIHRMRIHNRMLHERMKTQMVNTNEFQKPNGANPPTPIVQVTGSRKKINSIRGWKKRGHDEGN